MSDDDEGEENTDEHKCSVREYRAGKGAACVHVIAKCPNCKGPVGT